MAQMVLTAGIDVSKEWLDVALWPKKAEQLRVTRDRAGYAELATWLRQHEVTRVGLEASGGYEIEVIDALEAESFEVARLNAQRVNAEAKLHRPAGVKMHHGRTSAQRHRWAHHR
ncbi:MAG TPA: transposase [Methyloceanibacter sp.]